MTTEIQKSQESYKSLEKVLRTSRRRGVRKLYEEMETQIRAERETKYSPRSEQGETAARGHGAGEIREKEKLCQELMKNHEKILRALEESQSYVEELQKKFKERRRKRAQAAIALSEGIALGGRLWCASWTPSGRTLDSGDRGLGFGEIVHFREGGEEGSSARREAQPEGQRRLEGRGQRASTGRTARTLADIMDGDEDDCEYDYDGDAGAFGGAGGGFGRGSPIVYETIESESYQPVNLVPPLRKPTLTLLVSTDRRPKGPATKMPTRWPPLELNSSEAAMLWAGKSPKHESSKWCSFGDSGVAQKLHQFHRFWSEFSFKSTFSATIGIDFQIKTMCVEEQVICAATLDTAGQA
uniref:FCH and double SH3 domains 2 n=1 Tax=Macrostomum lignano TaxID=282301 RepID=A0A1I8F5U0_9PLAT